MPDAKVPAWLPAALTLSAFASLVWLERKRPLRREVEPKLAHTARNLAVAAAGGLALRVAERPVAATLAALAERRRWGLINRLHAPRWLEVTLSVVLLDYTLYVWHVLTHRVDVLWRFHAVHHADLDLDASTALRFHFGELLVSVAWRAGQVVGLGISPLALSVWQTLLLLSILFHHSNVCLPVELERRLVRFIATPRMHGIHHSVAPDEMASNWSSGLTLWDWLHGTLRLDVPQERVTIGVAALQSPDDVKLGKMLLLPFTPSPPATPE